MTHAAVNPITAVFRDEWPRLVATLMRELRDLELVEDVAQEAFVEASRRWRIDGMPDKPGAWLLTTARRKAIDQIRRAQRFDDRLPALAEAADREVPPQLLVDDQLALLFGCCHPALHIDAQVALTLRSVGGLTTAQIAHAFLVPEPTMAKRLVRAKQKIRTAGVPFTIPTRDHLDERLESVCAVVYAIFTEGHTSSYGATLLRGNLCDEAIWLAEVLVDLAPTETEVRGLAALCLLTDARRSSRIDADGRPVLLADQDRSQWDQDKLRRGFGHLIAARPASDRGPYQLQATIAAIHGSARTYADTDWSAIVAVYDSMLAQGGGAIVELNRAAAVAERDGPEAALVILAELGDRGALDDYLYFHSALAELHRRTDNEKLAAQSYIRAIEICDNEAERAFLEQRLNDLTR